MKMKQFVTYALLAAASAFPLQAGAHSLWVNMTHWKTPVQAEKPSTRMYIGWGHAFPVDSLTKAEDFESCTLILPNGKREALAFEHEGISTAPILTNASGEYMISLVRKPSVYTYYMEDCVEKKTKAARDTVKNPLRAVRSQQCATAHFFAGNGAAGKPMRAGNTLELVPLENPYQTGKNYFGAELPVRLLLDGSPVPYQEVTATYAGFSTGDAMAQRLLTDRDGIAHLRVTHWGVWLLKAKAERKAEGAAAKSADTEVYYTTLTFEI